MPEPDNLIMKRWKLLPILLFTGLLCLCLGPHIGHAQIIGEDMGVDDEASETEATVFAIGVKGGLDIGDAEDPFIGGDTRIRLGSNSPLQLNPTFNYYFLGSTDASAWTLGLNLTFSLSDVQGNVVPYVGIGGQLLRQSVELRLDRVTSEEFGIGGVAGIEFNVNNIRPFVQVEPVYFPDPELSLVGVSGGLLLAF